MGNLEEKVALLFILVSRDSGNLLREEFAPLEANFFKSRYYSLERIMGFIRKNMVYG